MIQIADKGSNRPLEIDVVFTKGIVGIDEKRLAGSELEHTLILSDRLG
jgi:hypothetical protein